MRTSALECAARRQRAPQRSASEYSKSSGRRACYDVAHRLARARLLPIAESALFKIVWRPDGFDMKRREPPTQEIYSVSSADQHCASLFKPEKPDTRSAPAAACLVMVRKFHACLPTYSAGPLADGPVCVLVETG